MKLCFHLGQLWCGPVISNYSWLTNFYVRSQLLTHWKTKKHFISILSIDDELKGPRLRVNTGIPIVLTKAVQYQSVTVFLVFVSSNVIWLIQISFVRGDWCDRGTDMISSVSHFAITGVFIDKTWLRARNSCANALIIMSWDKYGYYWS